MSDYLPRSAWNARPARPGPGSLDPRAVEGIAFHWPGTTSRRPISKAAIPRALRSWQDYHLDGHGWSDIGYQIAIDQYGRRWTLRGLETQSGANGNADLNRRFCAVLLVLVAGEQPSELMLEAARATVADARRLYPGARRLVGHGDIRPGGTTCPGPAVRSALRADLFNPDRKEVDDMPTPTDLWQHEIPIGDGDKRPAQLVMRWAWRQSKLGAVAALHALNQANRNRDALVKLAEQLAPAELAAELVELLGERIDVSLKVEGELDESP